MNSVSRQTALVTTLLAALLAAAPLWGPGMVNTRGGGDSPFLLWRTHQMATNLRAGVFPARWMPDAAYGLGYPFFNYYAALPYYLAGGLALIGVDILTAIQAIQTLGFLLAALAMYGWILRLSGNQGIAWLAAIGYTVAPFHLVNVYVRGDSLSEFYAFAFYPLILERIDALGQKSTRRPSLLTGTVISLGLAYAGLLLTHNISAFIFSPFAGLYGLVWLWRKWRAGDRRWLLMAGQLATGVGIALLLTTWFWLPALVELPYVQLGPSTQDYFHYSRHFRTLNLVQNRFLFDYSIAGGHKARSPFAMGLPQAVLAALGSLSLLRRGIRRQIDGRWVVILAGLVISTLMITPLSRPIWDHLPMLPVVQFPWRFLSVQALFAAATTAAIFLPVPGRRTPSTVHTTVAMGIVALVSLVSTLLSLHPDRLAIGPADVTVERLQLYELFTGNIGTTIRYEWLPRTTNPRPYTSEWLTLGEGEITPPPIPTIPVVDAAANAPPVSAHLLERGPTHQTWRVTGNGNALAFPLLYWPGWSAKVDGTPTDVWPIEDAGYLALTVPSGEHTITLRLSATPLRQAAQGVSLVAVILLTAICIRVYIRMGFPRCVRPPIHAGRGLLIAGLPVLIFLLIPHRDFPAQDALTMDFIQMPYLHHNPDGVNFEGQVRLERYTLSEDHLTPGVPLTVTLDWSDVAGPYTVTLELVSPAAVRPEFDVAPLAEATTPLTPPGQEGQSLVLQLPDDLPRGIYLLRLRLYDGAHQLRALTADGAHQQGELFLRPVWVTRSPTLPTDLGVLAPFGPAIRLHTVTLSQPASDRLSVQATWSTVQPVAANYGLSLRLVDAQGQPHVQLDTQPGYGFLPTSHWRPDEQINDRYTLWLPDDLRPAESYHLEVVLYSVSTLAAIGQVRLPDFSLPLEETIVTRPARRVFDLPTPPHPLNADFGDQIRLVGYDLQSQPTENAFQITLWWQALRTPSADYTIFIHLFDSPDTPPIRQYDAPPRGGIHPTSWWITGEVVSDTITFSLADIPTGTYRLAVGMYDQTSQRLAVTGTRNIVVSENRLILPTEVHVP